MKLSALGLGLAVVAGSAMVSASAQAATLSFTQGPLSLTSDAFEFEFIPPTQGDFISKLFVARAAKNSVVQTLFNEVPSNNGNVTPSNGVTSTGWATSNASYILGWGPVSATGPALLSDPRTVYSNDANPVQFRYSAAESVGGWHVFEIEDIRPNPSRGIVSDLDYNDGKFKVRAVPVPAIVPGIALAAAFFGSKALKRNKKNTSESVA